MNETNGAAFVVGCTFLFNAALEFGGMAVYAASIPISPPADAATFTARRSARGGPKFRGLQEQVFAEGVAAQNGTRSKTKRIHPSDLVLIGTHRQPGQQFEKRTLNCTDGRRQLWIRC
jgi:hypothetical protein